MTLSAERTKLLQRAGRDRATRLLPPPYQLWYSDHDTGCQMTIVAKDMPVWCGSIWYSHIYEFNDHKKIAGLQPDFAFAKDAIEKYFSDVEADLSLALKKRDEQKAAEAANAEAKKRADLAEIRSQIAVSLSPEGSET